MPVSMSEIAEKVGVSTVTVSRALRGIGRMRPGTRQAIRATARKMGYPLDNGVLRRGARSRGTSEFQPHVSMPVFRLLKKEYFQPSRSKAHLKLHDVIQGCLERNQGENGGTHL